MNQPTSARAVHTFYLRALDEHFRGKVAPLLRAIGPHAPASSTAHGWKKLENAQDIPAWFIVEISRATGMPLDELLLGAEESTTLERRVLALEAAVFKLIDIVSERLGVNMEDTVEIPRI